MRPVRNPERDDTRLSRRTVLRSIGAAGIAGVATSASAADEAEHGGDETGDADGGAYSVVQGDTCFAVDPLSGSDPVEELYDLRIPEQFDGDNGATDPGSGPYYQSNGTTDLQRPDATVTFLYDGPTGLSLVVVHDSPESGGGGAVTFTVRDVPADAAWAVKDDLYLDPGSDAPADSNYDNWHVDGSSHAIDWTWGDAGTDGGALRTGGDDLAVTIDPSFNDAAALWGEHYAEDPITDWQFLSFPNGRDEPERTSLSLGESVTVETGACEKSVDRSLSTDGVLSADVDVKPGSDENAIDPESDGVTPVAILASDDLAPDDIDVETIRFGPPSVVSRDGDGAEPEHGGHDEGEKLVLHFPIGDADFESEHRQGKVVGETDDGERIAGTDRITVVGEKGDSEETDDDEDDEDRTDGKDEKAEKQEQKEEKDEDEEEDEDDDEDEEEDERDDEVDEDDDDDEDEDEEDDEDGPPDHAGPPEDKGEGKGNGPPEHAGPPGGREDDEDEDDTDDGDEEDSD